MAGIQKCENNIHGRAPTLSAGVVVAVDTHLRVQTCPNIYIYIYIYVCVCVCVSLHANSMMMILLCANMLAESQAQLDDDEEEYAKGDEQVFEI